MDHHRHGTDDHEEHGAGQGAHAKLLAQPGEGRREVAEARQQQGTRMRLALTSFPDRETQHGREERQAKHIDHDDEAHLDGRETDRQATRHGAQDHDRRGGNGEDRDRDGCPAEPPVPRHTTRLDQRRLCRQRREPGGLPDPVPHQPPREFRPAEGLAQEERRREAGEHHDQHHECSREVESVTRARRNRRSGLRNGVRGHGRRHGVSGVVVMVVWVRRAAAGRSPDARYSTIASAAREAPSTPV